MVQKKKKKKNSVAFNLKCGGTPANRFRPGSSDHRTVWEAVLPGRCTQTQAADRLLANQLAAPVLRLDAKNTADFPSFSSSAAELGSRLHRHV